MRHETLKVAPSLTLHLDADAFTVTEVTVTTLRDTDEAPLAEVRLTVEVDAVTWLRLERSTAFHLDTARRGPSMVERFEPASPIRIEATLEATETLKLPPTLDAFDAAVALNDAAPTDALRRADRWWVRAVTQELAPGLRGGFSVSWDHEEVNAR